MVTISIASGPAGGSFTSTTTLSSQAANGVATFTNLILDTAGACYQFTGGFAGNLHGSRWPLHDLDVDVARADLPQLAERLRPYTTRPLGLYVDHEFELQLVRAETAGVEIDVSQAEEAYARVGGQRVPLDGPLLPDQESALCALLLAPPADRAPLFKLPSGFAQWLVVIGITADEWAYAQGAGSAALIAALRAAGVGDLTDAGRGSIFLRSAE